MQIVLQHRHHTHTDAGVETHETNFALDGLESPVAGLLALALAGGVHLSSFDIGRLAEHIEGRGTFDIAASANPVPRPQDFAAISAAISAANVSIAAATDAQAEFEWREVTGEDILALVHRHGGAAIVERDPRSGVIDSITASFTEYDPAEMRQVLESLEATGSVTPTQLVGDLAQTSITTSTGQEQIISLAEWSISWKRKMVESTTTDNALYESSLGSSKSWTAKAKFMFVDGDQSQIDGVLSAINTTALAPLTWNFFPTVATGRQAFSGLAFIDGIDIGSGSGKIVGLDVSLKGSGPLNLKTQQVPVANANTVTGISGQV